jgi:hypothetical protein
MLRPNSPSSPSSPARRHRLLGHLTLLATAVHRGDLHPRPGGGRDDRGQTTAGYGLVILAAGTLALAAILWARSSGSITGLFQSVIDQLTGTVGG